MKWFKHISDSLDDPFIFELMTKHGADGYLVFFGVLEIYAREFKPDEGWNLHITIPYLKQKFHKTHRQVIVNCLQTISKLPANSNQTPTKLPANSDQTPGKLPANSSKSFSNKGRWDVTIDNDQVTIFIPKFRELMDEWTLRKLGSGSGVTPKILKTELDIDKDKDKDKNILPTKPPKEPPPPPPKKQSDFVLPDWIPKNNWDGFIEHRKKMRKPITDRAKQLIVNKLADFRMKGHQPGPLLDEAVERGWLSVFEPKADAPKPQPQGMNYGRYQRGARIPEQIDRETQENIDRINALARKIVERPPGNNA